MSLHFCKHTMVVFPHNSQTFTMNKPCLLEFRSNNVVDWTIIHCDSRRSRSCVGWNVQVLLHNCSGIWPLHVFNKCVILLLDCDWKVVGSLFLWFFCWSTSCKTWLFIPFPSKPSNFNLQHPISYAQSFSFVVMFWIWSKNPEWKIHKLKELNSVCVG